MTPEVVRLLVDGIVIPASATFLWFLKRVFDKLLVQNEEQTRKLGEISEKMGARIDSIGVRVGALEQTHAVHEERIAHIKQDVSGLGRRLNEYQKEHP